MTAKTFGFADMLPPVSNWDPTGPSSPRAITLPGTGCFHINRFHLLDVNPNHCGKDVSFKSQEITVYSGLLADQPGLWSLLEMMQRVCRIDAGVEPVQNSPAALDMQERLRVFPNRPDLLERIA
jgi:hypothetical protein